MFRYAWGPVEEIIWLVGLRAAVFAFWMILDALTTRRTSVVPSLILLIVTSSASSVFVLSESAFLGHLGGILAAALGASVIRGWLQPTLSRVQSATTVVTTLLAGLWLNGYFYADVPPVSALLLVLAPVNRRREDVREIRFLTKEA